MECKDVGYRACKAASSLDVRIAKLSMLTLACFALGCVSRGGGQRTERHAAAAGSGSGGTRRAAPRDRRRGARRDTRRAPPGGGSSGLPVPPGAGMPRPSGTPGNITVLNWAGFKSAVSYTFDDTNSSQISNYAALNALGVRMTFYLITNKTTEFNNAGLDAGADATATRSAATRRSHQRTGTAADVDAADMDLRNEVRHHRLHDGVALRRRQLHRRSRRPATSSTAASTTARSCPTATPTRSTSTASSRPRAPPRAPSTARSTPAGRPARWKTVLVHGFTGGSDGAYQPVAIGEFTVQRELHQVAGRRLDRHGASTSPPTGARRRCSRRSRRRRRGIRGHGRGRCPRTSRPARSCASGSTAAR